MDSEFLRNASTVGVFIAVALLCAVLIWIRSLATKLVLALLVAAGAFGLFVARDDLRKCERTCDCSLLGDHIVSSGCGFAETSN
jgi:UDP-N-acetylmuramyl pentapeptide phosphotransferase/UDP-N-acetylglucosamine-1-phosphate transferase